VLTAVQIINQRGQIVGYGTVNEQTHAFPAREGRISMIIPKRLIKLLRWFWCSVFGQQYENAPNSQAEKDFGELKTWMAGGSEPESVGSLNIASLKLRLTRPKQLAVYRSVMSLILQNGALDFHKRGPITSQLIADKKNPAKAPLAILMKLSKILNQLQRRWLLATLQALKHQIFRKDRRKKIDSMCGRSGALGWNFRSVSTHP
jgi:hypothetical protein